MNKHMDLNSVLNMGYGFPIQLWARRSLSFNVIILRYAEINIYLLLCMGFINIYSFFVLLLVFGHLEYTLIYNLSLILILAFCGYIIGTAPCGSV